MVDRLPPWSYRAPLGDQDILVIYDPLVQCFVATSNWGCAQEKTATRAIDMARWAAGMTIRRYVTGKWDSEVERHKTSV